MHVIFSLGERKFLYAEKQNIRLSQDWIDNKWVDVLPKPNIISYLSCKVSSRVRLSANFALADRCMSACSGILESKLSTNFKVEVAQKVEPELSDADNTEVDSEENLAMAKTLIDLN